MKRKLAAVFLAAALVVSGSSLAWAAEGTDLDMEKDAAAPLAEGGTETVDEREGAAGSDSNVKSGEDGDLTAEKTTSDPDTAASNSETVNPEPLAETITGTDINGLTWTLTDGVVTISGNGIIGNFPFERDGEIEQSVTSVVIEEGVTGIGVFVFRDLVNLKEVSIPKSVVKIDSTSFEGCGLTSIEIPDSVTEIGNYAFANCTNLSVVKIPDSVTKIGVNAFAGCVELSEVTMPSGLTEIGISTFNGCVNLTGITIPDNVIRIGDRAFSDCRNLTNLVIPNKVTEIAYRAFSNCDGIPEVTLPASVKTIGHGAFAECAGLQTVTFEGDAPEIGGDIHRTLEPFQNVTATAYYPSGNKTWTWSITKDLGSKLYWPVSPKTPASTGRPTNVDKAKELRIIPEATDNTYIIGSDEGATIKCTGELKDFVSVYVDDREVDRSNYTLEEGSTVLTFLTKYLNTLSVGKHKVTMNYTYGSVDTELNVLAKSGGSAAAPGASGVISSSNGSGSANGASLGANRISTSGNASSPRTGDQSTIVLWMLIAMFAAGIAIIVTNRGEIRSHAGSIRKSIIHKGMPII